MNLRFVKNECRDAEAQLSKAKVGETLRLIDVGQQILAGVVLTDLILYELLWNDRKVIIKLTDRVVVIDHKIGNVLFPDLLNFPEVLLLFLYSIFFWLIITIKLNLIKLNGIFNISLYFILLFLGWFVVFLDRVPQVLQIRLLFLNIC